ncbi:histon 4 (nucleomorph) [Lotharella oceanica]|uniref:Histone H4 n=1 Tax=Lotharella oceanica TaxID=641309 RepID=A0A060DAR7_9EUKA|nr:histon 4 [Lotharella oceanica]|mmetsp:Transcript_4151/g.7988  ORF Transcript_4151/g.7988 Transcript_4151/m.7988 type:complete len:99 (-) Transcript_4151:794-1090(-)
MSRLIMNYSNKHKKDTNDIMLSKKIFQQKSLLRIIRRSGIKRISRSVYIELNSIIKKFLLKIVKDTLIVCIYNHRKIITASDVIFSLKRNGQNIYGGL